METDSTLLGEFILAHKITLSDDYTRQEAITCALVHLKIGAQSSVLRSPCFLSHASPQYLSLYMAGIQLLFLRSSSCVASGGLKCMFLNNLYFIKV